MKPLRETKAAAEFVCRSAKTIYRMVEDGRLKAYRTHPNGPLLFKEEDLLAAVGIEPGEQPSPKRGRPSLETIA